MKNLFFLSSILIALLLSNVVWSSDKIQTNFIVGMSAATIHLPSSMDFAVYGNEPNQPLDIFFEVGLQGEVSVGKDFSLSAGGIAYPIAFESKWNWRRWPAPGEGEAYTCSDIEPGYYTYIAFAKKWDTTKTTQTVVWQNTSTENSPVHIQPVAKIESVPCKLGVKVSFLNLKVSQGYQRFSAFQPLQYTYSNSVGLSLFYQKENIIYELGPISSVELGNHGRSMLISCSVKWLFGGE